MLRAAPRTSGENWRCQVVDVRSGVVLRGTVYHLYVVPAHHRV
ncbi:hypothetical protein [Actinomadura vinacea]